MRIHYLSEAYAPWLAPYAYGIVLLGFVFFLFRAFEGWFAKSYNRPLFRHYFVYKKLKPSQVKILNDEFEFYNKLSVKHKKQFQHRVAEFLSKKKFIGRGELIVTEKKNDFDFRYSMYA